MIMEAALELFEERGYSDTTVPEIARKAGIATGTIYIYFKTKEALVNALYRHWKTEFNEKVFSGVEQILPGRKQLSTIWSAMADFAQQNPTVMGFLELHRHAGYLDASNKMLEGEIFARATNWIERGIRVGALGPHAADVAIGLVWGALTGMLKFANRPDAELNPHIIAAYEEALWQALRVRDP